MEVYITALIQTAANVALLALVANFSELDFVVMLAACALFRAAWVECKLTKIKNKN